MNFNIYTIYDRVSGTYGEPFLAQKDVIAQRRFNYFMQNSPMVSQDCELYCLGCFDTECGKIESISPMFICKSEVVNG